MIFPKAAWVISVRLNQNPLIKVVLRGSGARITLKTRYFKGDLYSLSCID